MKLIDVDKLFEAMNERYNEKKDIVSDTLSEGFMQMDKLIHKQEVFDLAEHDKQVRAEVIDEFLMKLFVMRNFNDWNEIQKIAEQMKGEQNE